MGKKSGFDELAGVLLGIVGGLILVEVLKNLAQKKCPTCQNMNEPDREYCKFCGGRLN